ncbi:MAG: hypothetical protein ACK5DD_10320 [Cyclobacteriaceae bacterium]|jgi:hypothetical protein
MSKNGRSKRYLENQARKWREVRDLYSHLRKIYRPAIVYQLFEVHYHIHEAQVNWILKHVDSRPVENPSLVYQQFIKPAVNILDFMPQQPL